MRAEPGPSQPADPLEGADARRLADGRADQLVREEPLMIDVHGNRLLTMRTPGRDQDLATGFLLGEGLIRSAAEVVAVETVPADTTGNQPDEVRVTLDRTPDAAARNRLSRTHEIRSSCGVCGLGDPQQILEDTPPLLPGVPRLSEAQLTERLTLLQAHQPLFASTGACHGAVVCTEGGAVLGHGEDVGRHNALDKAIGMAARQGADLARCLALLSGRAGYDLVVKCLRVRIPVIISVSAPSALAFDLCQAAGATLIGFARGDRFQVYCDPGRILPS